jgi:hypothetical protein
VAPARALLTALLAAAIAAGLVTAVVLWRPSGPEPAAPDGGVPTAFASDEVVALRLERPGETVELRRGATWQIVVPRDLPADADAVRGLVSRLAELGPLRVVGPATDLAQHGLAPPRVRLEARLRDGRVRTVALGAAEPFGGGAFARLDPGGPVVVIANETATGLDRRLHDLRDRRLVRRSLKDATRVRLLAGETRVDLARTESGEWSVGGNAPADDFAVRGLLSTLSDLRAVRYLAEGGVDLGAHGLDRPDGRVSVEIGEETVRIAFARRLDGSLAAAVEGGTKVAEVGEAVWRSVARSPGAWRAPRALKFERDQVLSIRVSRPGELVLLERGPGDRWEILAPSAAAASPAAVRRLLVGLASLEAQRERGGDLGATSLEVLLLGERGQVLDGLQVGRAAGDARIARSVRWPVTFRVEASALGALPLTLGALRAVDGG